MSADVCVCISMHKVMYVRVCVFVIGEGINARISFRFIDLTPSHKGHCCNLYTGTDKCVAVNMSVESRTLTSTCHHPQFWFSTDHWFNSEAKKAAKIIQFQRLTSYTSSCKARQDFFK